MTHTHSWPALYLTLREPAGSRGRRRSPVDEDVRHGADDHRCVRPAGRLTAKALRLYDEMGLIEPAEVDPATGYRHYGPHQLELGLRLVGMPLARISEVADLPREAALAAVTSYWRRGRGRHPDPSYPFHALVEQMRAKETQMTGTSTRGARWPASEQGGRPEQLDGVHAEERLWVVVAHARGTAGRAAAAAVTAFREGELAGEPVAALDAGVVRAQGAVEAPGATGQCARTLRALISTTATSFLSSRFTYTLPAPSDARNSGLPPSSMGGSILPVFGSKSGLSASEHRRHQTRPARVRWLDRK